MMAPAQRSLHGALLTVVLLLAACDSKRDASEAGSSRRGIWEGRNTLLGTAFTSVIQRNALVRDEGPGIRADFSGDLVVLVMEPASGDSINALQPPVLETIDGNRRTFSGMAVTPDSAYFIGDITLALSRAVLPLRATLHTSYCRSGERLCRSVSRPVEIAESGENRAALR